MKSIEDRNKMIFFQHSLRNVMTWLLNPRTKYLDIDGDHIVQMIADHLNRSYRLLDPCMFESRTVIKKVKPFDSGMYLNHDFEYLHPIVDLYEFVNEHLKPYVSSFFLHGSLATLDYCRGWSDVDTFVVVSKRTLHDKASFVHFRKKCIEAYDYLLTMDPLQHHGLIFVTEYDLECYPSIFMPLRVFDYAISLLDNSDNIVFNIRASRDEALNGMRSRHRTFAAAAKTGILKHHAYQGEYLLGEFRNSQNAMYQLKYLLDQILIFPSYFLEMMGQPCYKGKSFVRCAPFFDPETWQIVEKATEVRAFWPNYEKRPYQGNSIPVWVQKIVGPNYLEKSFRLIDAMMRKFEQAKGALP